MPQMTPQLMPQTYLSVSYLVSSKRFLFKNMAHDGPFQHCTWLYLALSNCARLYLAVPGSALVCHDLPFHRLPPTSTDWPKCFCIYRLKCSKATSGRMEVSVLQAVSTSSNNQNNNDGDCAGLKHPAPHLPHCRHLPWSGHCKELRSQTDLVRTTAAVD